MNLGTSATEPRAASRGRPRRGEKSLRWRLPGQAGVRPTSRPAIPRSAAQQRPAMCWMWWRWCCSSLKARPGSSSWGPTSRSRTMPTPSSAHAAATTAWSMTSGIRPSRPVSTTGRLAVSGVARGPEQPIVPRVLVLEHVRRALDHHTLEPCPRLRVVRNPRHAPRRHPGVRPVCSRPPVTPRPTRPLRPFRPGARRATVRRTTPGPG